MSLHTIGIGHMCVTQSDTFRYARPRYLIADDSFFGVGDGGRGQRGGPSQLRYYKQLLLPSRRSTANQPNVTCATRASPAPARGKDGNAYS